MLSRAVSATGIKEKLRARNDVIITHSTGREQSRDEIGDKSDILPKKKPEIGAVTSMTERESTITLTACFGFSRNLFL